MKAALLTMGYCPMSDEECKTYLNLSDYDVIEIYDRNGKGRTVSLDYRAGSFHSIWDVVEMRCYQSLQKFGVGDRAFLFAEEICDGLARAINLFGGEDNLSTEVDMIEEAIREIGYGDLNYYNLQSEVEIESPEFMFEIYNFAKKLTEELIGRPIRGNL